MRLTHWIGAAARAGDGASPTLYESGKNGKSMATINTAERLRWPACLPQEWHLFFEVLFDLCILWHLFRSGASASL
jgi:hypothetical protein